MRYGNKAEPIGSSLYPMALSEVGLWQIGCLFSAFVSFVDPLAVREFDEGWKVYGDKSNRQEFMKKLFNVLCKPSYLSLISYKL